MTRLVPGQEVDRYIVEGVLGRGGAATVYAVRHKRLNSLHALKVMSISTSTYRRRLLLEGRGQAGLRHPNVVSVFDVLDIDGAPALLMEYVAGPTLNVFLKRGNYTMGQALWLFRGVVLGVGAAHRRGLVHRDLEPDNVLLAPTNDGLIPKVTDFGLVKQLDHDEGVTYTGIAVGTAPYMAPEQVRDAADVDQRADLWALGCMLYEMSCGRRPFEGPDVLHVFNAIRRGDFVPPAQLVSDLPPAVLSAIEGLLVVDPYNRIASCDELFERLFDQSSAPERVDAADFVPVEEPAYMVLTQDTTAPTGLLREMAPSPMVGQRLRLAPLMPEPNEDLPPRLVASMSISAERPPEPAPDVLPGHFLALNRRFAVVTAGVAVALAASLLFVAIFVLQNDVTASAGGAVEAAQGISQPAVSAPQGRQPRGERP